MKVFKTRLTLLSYLKNVRKKKSIGFIPTMGALHDGHLKLIKESKKECEITICSIFVNPKQFNSTHDFESYPNELYTDLNKLQKIACDIVYTPAIDDLYTKNEVVKKFNFGTLASAMEGKFRVGHFNGMATVVEKFFHIIQPTKAFFGQKDLQQLQIIKALVKKMNVPITIISVPTVRTKNGLAESSRNKLLSSRAKIDAELIYRSLNYCRKNKHKNIAELKSYIKNQFKKQPKIKLEYAEFVSLNTMEPIKIWKEKNETAICIAAHIDGVRLIDNIIL